MTEQPPRVFEAFRESVEETAWKIVGAIASDKGYQHAMARNVAAMVDAQVAKEFDMLRDQLVKDHPKLRDDVRFAGGGFPLRRYAHLGTSQWPVTGKPDAS